MILSAVWTSPPVKTGWSETIPKPAGPDSQTEVGLFGSSTNTADIQDLKMGGLLAPIGQGDALSMAIPPTLTHLHLDRYKLTRAQNQQCSRLHHDTTLSTQTQRTPSRSTTLQVSIQP